MIKNEYVVYKTKYSGTKLPEYYIGSTSLVKIKNGYFGSVRSKKYRTIFELELKNNKNLFSVEILSYHDSRKDALIEELRVQNELDVVNSDKYFNESYASKNGYFGRDTVGVLNPMYGKLNEVIAINVKDGCKVRVTKFEYDNNVNLSGHTLNMLSVIDSVSGEKIRIKKCEYNKEVHIHHNNGIKHSKETKNKLSEIRKNMITAKDWEGNFHRVNKEDVRFSTGEFGNTNSKRWLITDVNGDKFKTLNINKFLKERGMRFPEKNRIDGDGLVSNVRKSKKFKSLNGWILKSLD